MTMRGHITPQALRPYGMRSGSAAAAYLYPALLFLGAPLLILPYPGLRALVIVVWGALIFAYERHIGLPVPATPGVMLWLGSTLSYVIGGLGTVLFYGRSYDTGLLYLDSALLYLGLGLAAYALGLWLVGQYVGPLPRRHEVASGLTFPTASILLITALFVLPVLGKRMLSSFAFIDVYNNLIIGAVQSIESVPMILMAFYLRQRGFHWWTGVLFLSAALANPLESMLIGYGRIKLPFALIAMAAVWLALIWYSDQRVTRRVKVVIALMPLALTFFFGLNTAYRNQVNLDKTLTSEERLQAVEETARTFGVSGNIIVDSIGPLLSRLVESPSLELLGWAESGEISRTGWTLNDSKQVLFSWIPKVLFPEKGKGYGRDIMEDYGLSPSWNNIPVTILSDAYRRLGLVGVLGLYFMMGVVSTTVAFKLLPRWGALGAVLAFYFALLHLQIYSEDVLAVFLLYVYRLPSSGLVIYALLHLTRIWQPGRELNPG